MGQAVTKPRPDATIGGYTLRVRYGRVYLVDQHPDTDPGMTTTEARALADALADAADKVERKPRTLAVPDLF
jgi:hypothetical protein